MAIEKDAEERSSERFDEWIKGPTEGTLKTAAELGTKGRWPTAEEIKNTLRKQGDSSDTVRTPIQFLDPAYFDPILFFIQHRDRKELNFRLRYYFEYHPLISNIISLHSEFPLSDFSLQCADSSIQRRYEDMSDRIEMLPLLMDILKDYWLLGESFPYGRWSDSEQTWDYFSLIPPEKIELRSSYVTPNPIVILQVDESLKKVVNSADEVDKKILEMMDPVVVEKMKTQNYMPLPSWQVSHFSRKTSRTDLRGTSMVKACLKDLMYEDKLRLLQFTFADRHMFPLKIFKLGNPQTGWIPNRAHFEMLRQLLVSASNDPDFNIIFHHGLQVDYVGTKDKIANLIPEFEFVQKRILTGLFANEALVHGSGATYANANVSVRVLMHRYLTIRNKLELWANNKVFYQVAKARGYWVADTSGSSGQVQTKVNGKYKVLDLPKIRWQKLNLIDDTAQKNFLMRLRERGEIPHKMIAEMFDLSENDLRAQLKEEQGTVVDPAYIDARKTAARDKKITKDILEGKKTDAWNLKHFAGEDEDKANKLPPKTRETLPEEVAPQPTAEEASEGPVTPSGV